MRITDGFKSWYDVDGVKRCNMTERTNQPQSCSVIIQNGQLIGVVQSGFPQIVVSKEKIDDPVTPASILILRREQ